MIRWPASTVLPIMLASMAPLLSGCDTLVTYRFEVANLTQDPITVRLETPKSREQFVMPPRASRVIYERRQTNSSVKPYFRDGELITWFSELSITGAGGQHGANDARAVSNWRFTVVEQGVGLYQLPVTAAHFGRGAQDSRR